jgi:hypothetical protein
MARAYLKDSDYLGMVPNGPTQQVMVFDDVAHRIHNTVVHSFMMGDVDEPDLYAAQPLWEWEQSDVGQWVMEHAIESPMWQRINDYNAYGTKYIITAKLKEVDLTVFLLKYK